MLHVDIVELPAEVVLSLVVAATTPDVLSASFACRAFHGLFFHEGQGGCAGSQLAHIARLGRGSAMRAQHVPPAAHLNSHAALIYVHSLGLPMRLCREYCAAARRFAPLQPLHFARPREVLALLAAHRRLSAEAEHHPLCPRGLLVGEACAVVAFSFDVHVFPLCSQWQWVEVSPLEEAEGGASHVSVGPLRLGVQLRAAEIRPSGVGRPEIGCALRLPTTPGCRVFLQAASAAPGQNFELSLAAGGFDAYDNEGGLHFPHEECLWRSPENANDKANEDDESSVEQGDGDHLRSRRFPRHAQEAEDEQERSDRDRQYTDNVIIRVLLRVRSFDMSRLPCAPSALRRGSERHASSVRHHARLSSTTSQVVGERCLSAR